MRSHALAQRVLVGAAQVDVVFEGSRGSARPGAGIRGPGTGRRPAARRRAGRARRRRRSWLRLPSRRAPRRSRVASESVMPGMMGLGLTPTQTPAERSLLHRLQAQFRPRRARFQQAREFLVDGGDRDVDAEHVAARDLAQQVEIAHDQVALGDQAEVPAALGGEDLQDGARAPEAALGGLVGVGGGADGDAVVACAGCAPVPGAGGGRARPWRRSCPRNRLGPSSMNSWV